MPKGVYKHKSPSAETRKKLSNARKGKKLSQEGRLKVSLSRKGKKLSKEHIEKLKGKRPDFIPWHKGKKCPSRSGSNCHLWKGGITSENKKLRSSIEMKLWRKACFERDNYTCQKTGQIGGKLVVHHINNFSDFPELRTSIENGITLSKEAHIQFHKQYGTKNNTREQLIEFLTQK